MRRAQYSDTQNQGNPGIIAKTLNVINEKLENYTQTTQSIQTCDRALIR